MRASAAATLSIAGTLFMSGAVPATVSTSGSLSLISGMGGVTVVALTLTGDLDAVTPIAGDIVASVSSSADLRGTASLSGASVASVTTAADVDAVAYVAGDIAATGAATADLRGTASLSGTTAGDATPTGDLTVDAGAGFAGDIVATATVAADLTGTADLAGAIAATGTAVGDAKGAASLSGTVTATASIVGDAKTAVDLAGAIAAMGTAVGDVKGDASLSGTTTATASATGDLTTGAVAVLAGSIAATGTAVGDMRGVADLSGAATATATAIGDVRGATALEGSATATGTAVGDIRGTASLSGTVAVAATATGDASIEAWLEGTATATVTPAADLTVAVAFVPSDISSFVASWTTDMDPASGDLTSWNDDGANNYDLDAITGDPQVDQDLGGNNAPGFDGVGDFVDGSGSANMGNVIGSGADGDYEVFVVVDLTGSDSGTSWFYDSGQVFGGADTWMGLAVDPTTPNVMHGYNNGTDGDIQAGDAIDITDGVVHVLDARLDAQTLYLRVDDRAEVNQGGVTVFRTMTDMVRVGVQYDGTSYITGTVSAWAFNQPLSAADRFSMYEYLEGIYGVTTPNGFDSGFDSGFGF